MIFTVIVKFFLASLKLLTSYESPSRISALDPKATILAWKTFTTWPSTGKSFEFFPYLTADRKDMIQSTNAGEGNDEEELNSS